MNSGFLNRNPEVQERIERYSLSSKGKQSWPILNTSFSKFQLINEDEKGFQHKQKSKKKIITTWLALQITFKDVTYIETEKGSWSLIKQCEWLHKPRVP